MCVIFVADKERPTDEMVEKAFDANDSGAGVAWRHGGAVHWKKGLDVEEAKALCRAVPLPFVAHFRIPSCGGASSALCHPFPIDKTADLKLEGVIKGYVLFHNGHWGEWKKNMLDSSIRGNVKIPIGKWSDSRAMALLAAYHGLGILEMIDEKIIAFGPDAIEVFGYGWAKVNEVWVSNKMWDTVTYHHHGRGRNHGVDNRLPTHYQGKADDKKDETKPEVKAEAKPDQKKLDAGRGGPQSRTDSPGGGSTETPFEVALRLFAEGKLSKKAFKRARRKWEAACMTGKALKRLPGIIH